jgi:hypothetical protein
MSYNPIVCNVLIELVLANTNRRWDIIPPMANTRTARKRTKLGKDRRRKHKHWQVTVFYKDGERFARVYTDREKAASFAERQRKSPVVKTARVLEVG